MRDRVVCMYALLPAMQGANAQLLLQAIKAMEQRYTLPELGHHLVRFRTILRRSKTLSEQDKQIVEEYMRIYDSLLESDPVFQQKLALERALERNLGLQAFRDAIIEIVKARFPDLVETAQQRITPIQKFEELKQLNIQLSIAPDQATARRILQDVVVN